MTTVGSSPAAVRSRPPGAISRSSAWAGFKVRIVDTTAAAGYTANLLVPGPAGQVSLIFENPEADDVRVAISCRNGQPQLSEWVRDR